jgi:homoserine O-succinyltransferase
MPINIDNELPARKFLEQENIFVMTKQRAESQDIRPLRILFLNLMPKKIETETQILRLLSNSPIQVDIEFLQMASHVSKTTPMEHMIKFYKTFDMVRDEKFDGMIVTGAPVEQMPFEEVDYWDELCRVFDWAQTHVYSTFNICWGAQAALYHKYGLKKYTLDKKVFGVFEHEPLDLIHPLMRGIDDVFYVPHSRHTEIKMSDIAKIADLQILSYSKKAGVHLISDMECRNFYSMGHSEYDANTLANEYFRDKEKGLDIDVPYNYFPDDDPTREPMITWRSTGSLIFTNWLNYFVYQQTPYEITSIC